MAHPGGNFSAYEIAYDAVRIGFFCDVQSKPEPEWSSLTEHSRDGYAERLGWHLKASSAADAHNKFVESLKKSGWTQGEFYDPIAMKNPMIVPWTQLSPRSKIITEVERTAFLTSIKYGSSEKGGIQVSDTVH